MGQEEQSAGRRLNLTAVAEGTDLGGHGFTERGFSQIARQSLPAVELGWTTARASRAAEL